MTRVARGSSTTIPSEDQLLCESCGYVLTNLPENTPCPECGQPASSSDPTLRRLPAWEDPLDPRAEIRRFLLTTAAVIARPRNFFRHLVTRCDGRAAYIFAVVHWILCSLMIGFALYFHLGWFTDFPIWAGRSAAIWAPLLALATYATLEATNSIAARLTHWEATYRGLRMPLPVVLRAMYYHAAHYLPVCAIALLTVVGYRYLIETGRATALSGPTYLYVLCAEIILAAFYLFKTYWTAMRSIMYASR